MIVLCPTRGRPKRAIEMWHSMMETAVLPDTQLVMVVDRDDPELPKYPPDWGFTRRFGWDPDAPYVLSLDAVETGNLVRATNTAASRFWDHHDILGHVGDDHVFRSKGWDRQIAEALVTPGIAYGNDLLMGADLPTAVFMSSVIPRTLGWFALPTCNHLYIDNGWKTLGQRLGCLHYLPDVVIEHMHPLGGKAAWDATYDHGNGPNIEHDRLAYAAWAAGPIEADLARVRAVLS